MVLFYEPNDSYQNYYNGVYFIYESQEMRTLSISMNVKLLLITKILCLAHRCFFDKLSWFYHVKILCIIVNLCVIIPALKCLYKL